MTPPSEPSILLFDGACNFCNGAVNFVLDRDRGGRFRFASLQSEVGQRLLREHGLEQRALSSSVLIERGRAYTDSSGVLRAARHLGLPWSLASVMLLIPSRLRDPVYTAFARSRYRLFGRTESCRVPTPELRARFLDLA